MRHRVTTLGRFLSFLIVALLAGPFALFTPASAQGAALTVNSTMDSADTAPGDGICSTAVGECTLRAAIQETNALPGANTIILPAGTYVIRTDLGEGEDAAGSGDLDITDDLDIVGAGVADTSVHGGALINAAPREQTLEVHSARALLSDLTVQNGGGFFTTGGGIRVRQLGTVNLDGVVVKRNRANAAGILNAGTLRVENSSLIDNFGAGSTSVAGGILNLGTASLEDVLFSGNGAAFGGTILNLGTLMGNNITIEEGGAFSIGGGILNANVMSLTNSTIRGNFVSTGGGGGIFNDHTLVLTNSTISDNTAFGFGGAGIHNRGGATLLNVTITGNNAAVDGDNAGGIYSDELIFPGGGLTVKNTIVGANIGGDCGGTTPIVSGGHNLSSDDTCGLRGPGDLINTDALLAPLADNGGPTRTHALLAGSPAIDAGDDAACPATDQRGSARPADGDRDGRAVCDIGAYEFEPEPCRADVNADGVVDKLDVRLVARSMGSRPGSPRWNQAAEVNGDGVINVSDLRIVVRAFVARSCV